MKPQSIETHRLVVKIEREGHVWHFDSGEMTEKTAKSKELKDFLLDFLRSTHEKRAD